jgi:GNAT superfamily N-acetyltransferase
MTMISVEDAVDYDLTARIATEAFAQDEIHFSAERIKWLYERSFGEGTTVLAVIEDGRKIGQISLVHQRVSLDGEIYPAIQLVDLFVLQAHRSAALIRRIYKEVERVCTSRNIRFVVTVPNDKSMRLNERFMKVAPFLHLQVRAGISFGWPRRSKLKFSGAFKSMSGLQAVKLFERFCGPAIENGLHWDAETLFSRLDDPTGDYAVHATDDLLLISSARRSKGVMHTMLCGFFARPDASIDNAAVRQVIRAACRHWKLPLFVYAGMNKRLPALPGIALPARLRAPMLVQLRDFEGDGSAVRFDRFQMIDSDFV